MSKAKAMNENTTETAGLWIRVTAGLIDLAGVAVLVVLTTQVTASRGWYIPIELTVIGTYMVYTAAAVAWTGQTVGGWVCGLNVVCRNGQRPSVVRALARAALVAVFQCSAGLPFLVVLGRRGKTGWHDVLTGTRVRLLPDRRAGRRRAALVVWLVVAACLAVQTGDAWRLYRIHRAWCADADARAEQREERTDSAVEVSSLDDAQRHGMATWLADHAQDPADYVIDTAARHQVTLIGEIHGQKQYLAFFNQIISDLYHKSGVRVLALECCHPDQDGELAHLVGDEYFDAERARSIARHAVWEAWGWKGYWDVLETVWRLNRSLSPEQKPMQVVGIAPRLDLPSLALVKGGPLVERLRVVRVIRLDGLVRLLCHDAHYARCVEQRAFDEGARTVVWVGAAHTVLQYPRRVDKTGRAVPRTYRMGSMLYGRYGDEIAQVTLHNHFQHGEIAQLIERCAEPLPHVEIAFIVPGSPFAGLRDRATLTYGGDPGLQFSDLALSYVLLVPHDALEPCEWSCGFVSRRMFGRNKPFYEMLCEQELADYHEADQNMSTGVQRL